MTDATSRRVTASSTPTEKPLRVRPVILAAPRMVLVFGTSANVPPVVPCGCRPMRRE
jgi:hypothetical protein